jgi:hypothetical protein
MRPPTLARQLCYSSVSSHAHIHASKRPDALGNGKAAGRRLFHGATSAQGNSKGLRASVFFAKLSGLSAHGRVNTTSNHSVSLTGSPSQHIQEHVLATSSQNSDLMSVEDADEMSGQEWEIKTGMFTVLFTLPRCAHIIFSGL